jgi:hypothetical protein
MNLKLILLTGLISVGLAMTANAGSILDFDTDLIPDVFDNCLEEANGPGDNTNQDDADLDGFGNICDGDLTNDGIVAGTDFNAFLLLFGGGNLVADFTGDGLVAGTDFNKFLLMFGNPNGPSGLACAGVTNPCP